MKSIIGSVVIGLLAGCANSNDGVGSEIATSVVSGALNNTSGSSVGWNTPRKSGLRRMLDLLNPISTADAATWMCTGGKLTPTFSGPMGSPYTFTPLSCSVKWLGNRTASSDWSGTFTLSYGASCDARYAFIESQDGGCAVTRTTVSGGNTRTITGPDGNQYAVTHDTNGGGTGWDSTVSPAPGNGGVVVTCSADGCADGATLVVNGSHITATVTKKTGTSTIWNHTVSTDATGLTVSGTGTSRLVTGTVTVQHNLLKATSTTTFNDVGYGDPSCCFPTSGSVTTSFIDGEDAGKSETLSFGNSCGETTLTTVRGTTESLTLQHCL